jgi:hypothetical protein
MNAPMSETGDPARICTEIRNALDQLYAKYGRA